MNGTRRHARLLRDGSELIVPPGSVRCGEIVHVRAGEEIPVDGTVEAGRADVSEPLLTGEWRPQGGRGRRYRQCGFHGRGRCTADPRLRRSRDPCRSRGALRTRSAGPSRTDRSGGGSRHRHIHSGGVADRRRQLLCVGLGGRLGARFAGRARRAGRGMSVRARHCHSHGDDHCAVHCDTPRLPGAQRSGARNALACACDCFRQDRHHHRGAAAGRSSTTLRPAHARESPA